MRRVGTPRKYSVRQTRLRSERRYQPSRCHFAAEVRAAAARIAEAAPLGRIGRPVISYLHTSYPREEMAALYRTADVMVVGSERRLPARLK